MVDIVTFGLALSDYIRRLLLYYKFIILFVLIQIQRRRSHIMGAMYVGFNEQEHPWARIILPFPTQSHSGTVGIPRTVRFPRIPVCIWSNNAKVIPNPSSLYDVIADANVTFDCLEYWDVLIMLFGDPKLEIYSCIKYLLGFIK